MTKKVISLIIVFSCLFTPIALAEGKLKVTEKNLIIFPGEDTGYFYAKVENVGDESVGLDSGDLVIFSEDDDILLSNSYVTTLPQYVVLDAGDSLYVKEFLWDSALEGASIGDYKFSVATEKRTKTITKVPCEATFDSISTASYDNYVYVTFTNPSDETLYDFYIVAALYDTEGTLIFVDSTSLSSIAVHPNSTITAKLYVDYDLVEYYEKNSIIPTTINAMVCHIK